MVFHFLSNTTDPPAIIYMGKDKFENEELIKFGWDCDVWFHVESLSSAHVYLRLTDGSDVVKSGRPLDANNTTANSASNHSSTTSKAKQVPLKTTPTPLPQSWTTIPTDLLQDLAQLTKANSIEGSKVTGDLSIIYTPLTNLQKTSSMATGQVGFHDPTQVRRVKLQGPKANAIVNRLEKTKVLKSVDELPSLKEAYLARCRAARRREADATRKKEDKIREERRAEKEEKARAWEELGGGKDGAGMKSNEDGFDEDDFM